MTHITTNEKAPGACDTEGLTTDNNDVNSATGQRHNKTVGTLIAELALAGHVVHKGQSGDYTVCKYAHAFYAQDFAALQAFARKVGVTV